MWIAIALLAVAMLAAPRGASAAALGPPDAPPAAAPAVSMPDPAPPPAPAPALPAPDPPVPPAGGAPAAGGPATPPDAAGASGGRERAAALRRERVARERKVAVIGRLGHDVADDLSGTASALSRFAVRGSLEAGPATSAPSGGGGLVIALLLVVLSGLTAAVTVLSRVGRLEPVLAVVEKHRLPLAGISTSCLLVALLLFAGNS